MGQPESKSLKTTIYTTLLTHINKTRSRFSAPPSASSIASSDRYKPCHLLGQEAIPNVIWFEDLLALHGSDTQLWDLTLLVDDPRKAADVLLRAGYTEAPHDTKFEGEPEFSTRGIRISFRSSETGVVLLPARDWYYDLGDCVQDFLPPLNKFLDSIIEFWLNISARDYVDRVRFALYIGCMINYCYYLKGAHGEPVKDAAYANYLLPEHREVHYDIVADYPQKESFTTTKRHQYHVRRRREIEGGAFTPKPYGTSTFRPSLTTLSEQ